MNTTTPDKAAEKVINELAKNLQANMDRYEYATSNPQKYITLSILEIRAALFELTKWQTTSFNNQP